MTQEAPTQPLHLTKEELLRDGCVSDIENIKNRIAGEMTTIAHSTNGIISLNENSPFVSASASLMKALPQNQTESVTSFAAVQQSIEAKLSKLKPDDQTKIKALLRDTEASLNASLSTTEGIKSLILENLKREAIKNIPLLDITTNALLNTPPERAPTEAIIAQNISLPGDIITFLNEGNSKFAQTTLKSIIPFPK